MSSGAGGSYSAKGFFDARKGKFIPHSQAALGSGGTYDPNRMTHAAQANRQMEAFFDTQAWEHELEERRRREAAADGSAQQRVTKQDIQRFKQKKKEKKAARYGWLKN